MSVTTTQADSIRAALKPPAPCTEDLVRPATHDLFKKVLDIAGVFATKAAITHIQDEVFIARLWIRLPDSDEEMHVDARPSDAIAMAVRSNAPLFLNSLLLRQWNVPVEAVERDAKHGLCETLTYSDRVKSTRSIREELRGKPEHIRLAKLKMELDLAVRLERFAEACDLKEQISRICPIEQLQEQLKVAVTEERFLDASRIQDQIIVWKARLRMWEKGSLDLDNFVEGEEQP